MQKNIGIMEFDGIYCQGISADIDIGNIHVNVCFM